MENQTMGKRIVSLRKACGLTQEQLAERLGISPQAVSKWENDVSCPDISMLPQLAEIFGVSTDVILGLKAQEEMYQAGAHARGGKTKVRSISHDALSLGLLAIVIGAAYLFSSLTNMPLNIWSIVWPAVVLGLGVSETVKRFTPIALGVALLGLYFLLYNLGAPLPFTLSWNTIWPIALILIGLTILFFRDAHGFERHVSRHVETSFSEDGGFLRSSVRFAEERHKASIQRLKGMDIDASFCESAINLSAITSVESGATANIRVAFGECRILLPRTVRLLLQTKTALGSVEMQGAPQDDAPYTLTVTGTVSFGALVLEYI